MRIGQWLDLFRNNPAKKAFTLHDLVLLSGESSSGVSVQLSRLVRSGLLRRPSRGLYINPFSPPTGEELSMMIRAPCYLSLEYALSLHGILSQNPHTYTLVTTKGPYTYSSDGSVFEYHQIKRSLYWGYHSQGVVNVASPEKALLDLIHIRLLHGTGAYDRKTLSSALDDMYLEELNPRMLEKHSRRFGDVMVRTVKDVVMKRR